MVRPPSKHGLERKFKSWRRGKAKTAKPKGSLKQQLRGHERLLAKFSEEKNSERYRELEKRVSEIKQEIATRQEVETKKQNAKESHGLRFLERQKLMRMERSTRKLWEQSVDKDEKDRYEQEMQRIALDQVYVAHFPHDVRYLPLFRNGVRIVDLKKKLSKRAITRKRILKNLENSDKVKWIASDQYERLPTNWSEDLERSTFSTEGKSQSSAAGAVDDNRFSLSDHHTSLLQVADEMESRLEKDEAESKDKITASPDESDSSDSSSSDNEIDVEADAERVDSTAPEEQSRESSDSSDSESDTSTSSSNSSSDESDEEKKSPVETQTQGSSVEDKFGDFFTTVDEDKDVFQGAKEDKPDYLQASGDKSKGWATQRQRPGQYKKRRTRS